MSWGGQAFSTPQQFDLGFLSSAIEAFDWFALFLEIGWT